jgi:transcriptional regulator of aroF, aroG, tyrA and aromatic amino acid transport
MTECRNKTIKQDLTTAKGRLQYISTCRLIHDRHDQIIGAVEIAKDVREIKKLANCLSKPESISFTDIIGRHDAINQAIAYAKKISESDAVINIMGESGTGKELFARAIHTHSRRPGSFIPVNCAALPEQLLESELFGYTAGAFTGGKRGGSAGLFEEAKDGTIFLDEIAELPLSAQAKLLRLIQERAVRRIGGTGEIQINARLITATNKSLEKLVQEKRFRQDLYYRISVLPIHIPPLRERIEDIPLLVDHFLFQIANTLDRTAKTLTRQALLMLRNHDWPGNIRELKNVVDRAAILCENDVIDTDNIVLGTDLVKPRHPVRRVLSNDLTLKQHVSTLEKDVIQKTLKTAPSLRQAAKILNISHPGLIKKMRKLDIRFSKPYPGKSRKLMS